MTDKPRVVASRWATPFENVDSDRLHLLRVTYPSEAFVSYANGPHYDFSEFTEMHDECEIIVFNEEDGTVYRIQSDANTIRIHDEHDLEQVDQWADETGSSTYRLIGSELHRTVSGFMNGDRPSYLLVTGNDCVEFLSLNDPQIEVVGKIEDTRTSFH
ncbi:hypothetical protein GRI69_05155 [Erythrobacter vulgaris]|uniref:Uncharacterized protein n=1 Tax=Qipengyuania vulgaris TaxID=291985 RepID=A0A844XPV1_9SPHN|nr:hypothetical protein [Qipengyuania vulgaris]MXO47640.1 hypothetical protein [Qipengyuania vulgaris]